MVLFVFLFLMVYFWIFQEDTRWHLFLGPLHLGHLFIDLQCMLASYEAYLLGIDVQSGFNPMDMFGRGHAYSPLWLEAAGCGLGIRHTGELGYLQFLFFAASTILVLKPRSWVQTLVWLLVALSPPVMLGVERGQVDVLMYSIVLLPFVLPSRYSSVKGVALWIGCYLGAVLKYFPLFCFTLFATQAQKTRTFILAAVFAMLGVILFVVVYYEDLTRSVEIFARPYSLWSFGNDLMFTVFLDDAKSQFAFRGLTLLIVGAAFFITFKTRTLQFSPARQDEESLFLVGASVYVLCFLANPNFDYRLVFLLPTLPYTFWLLKVPGWRVHGIIMLVAMVLFVWSEMAYYYLLIEMYGEWRIFHLRTFVAYKGGLSWIILAYHTILISLIFRNQLGYKFGFIPVDWIRSQLSDKSKSS